MLEDSAPHRKSRFEWPDLVVLVAFECVAIPICIAAGEAFVSGQYGRAFFGWGTGIPLAVAGFTAHWWKGWVNEPIRRWILRNADRWWPAAVLLAFAYVVGPDIYHRAIERNPSVSAPSSTAASENDAAIEAQKSALIEWLQKAQRERDEAKRQLQGLLGQQFPEQHPDQNPMAETCAKLALQWVNPAPPAPGNTRVFPDPRPDEIRHQMEELGCFPPKK